jgi:cell division protein FtsZ
MLVVGVGGGGANAVGRMIANWQGGPATAAVNTDAQALTACGVPVRVQIGGNLTQGLGAGGDPAVGRLAAEDDADVLRELVSQADIVFLVTTLGGGTGTGASPILAKIAREEGALTLCFATLPFDFEGERRQRQAEEGLRALRMHADVVIGLPNQRLLELVESRTGLADAFGKVDGMVGLGVRSLWSLLQRTGIINLDFADLRHLVEHSHGECAFGYGTGAGPEKASAAMADIMRSPLLDGGRILAQAGAVLLSIVGGPDLTLVEVQQITSQFMKVARRDVRLFMGATVDEAWKGKLALTVLAAETWQDEDASDTRDGPPKLDVDEMVAPPSSASKNDGGVQKPSKGKVVQANLNFDNADKGRFRNIEPTIYQGEDLDIPTFIRRGIKLSFDK